MIDPVQVLRVAAQRRGYLLAETRHGRKTDSKEFMREEKESHEEVINAEKTLRDLLNNPRPHD